MENPCFLDYQAKTLYLPNLGGAMEDRQICSIDGQRAYGEMEAHSTS